MKTTRFLIICCLSLVFLSSPQAQTQKQGSVRLPAAVDSAGKPKAADKTVLPEETGGAAAETVKSDEKGEKAADKGDKSAVKEELAAGGEDQVYINGQDLDIKDVIKQISKATGRNFIIDSKVSGKVTILSERTMTKEEAYQAFLSALEVAGFTTVTGPGGIIKIVALSDAMKSPIPTHVDSTPYTDSYVTRLVSLKNISALDMSNAIKDLKSKNGNIFAYPSTNTLIITDSGTNIDRLMKIIKELDQEGPQQVLEIIPINYADAKSVAANVLQLFELEKSGAPAAGRKPPPGGELEELKDVSKIIADERTNSLIVLASKRAISKVRDVIAKLDVPLKAGDTGSIHVHMLKYANAVEMAATLSSITSGVKGRPAGGAPPKAGEKESKDKTPVVAQLEGGIQIGADETTNALIITASAKDYQVLIDELISKLDIPRRQVYLEALVMDLDIQKGSVYGASGFGAGGNRSVIGFGNLGYDTAASILNPTSFFALPGLLGGLLSRDTITVTVPKTGGGTEDVTIPAFGAFLSLLQTYSTANIVSTPNLLTLDNQKASIEVTKTIYAKKQTTIATAGTSTVEPTPLEAGLTLEITPQISEGDAVRLEIHHKLSNFTAPPDPQTGAAPQTKREITTTVVANDGQTVVLGGLMQDVDTKAVSKIPILGDIPIIGLLFRRTTSGNTKNNLIVFITPHLIRDNSDFNEVTKAKIEQRNMFIEKNFGKRQQQVIRDTLAMHRADLLQYVAPPTSSSATTSSITPTQTPVLAPGSALPVPNVGQQQAMTKKTPVITVSPVGATGGGTQSTPPAVVGPGSPKPCDAGNVNMGY